MNAQEIKTALNATVDKHFKGFYIEDDTVVELLFTDNAPVRIESENFIITADICEGEIESIRHYNDPHNGDVYIFVDVYGDTLAVIEVRV